MPNHQPSYSFWFFSVLCIVFSVPESNQDFYGKFFKAAFESVSVYDIVLVVSRVKIMLNMIKLCQVLGINTCTCYFVVFRVVLSKRL